MHVAALLAAIVVVVAKLSSRQDDKCFIALLVIITALLYSRIIKYYGTQLKQPYDEHLSVLSVVKGFWQPGNN